MPVARGSCRAALSGVSTMGYIIGYKEASVLVNEVSNDSERMLVYVTQSIAIVVSWREEKMENGENSSMDFESQEETLQSFHQTDNHIPSFSVSNN